MRWFMYPVLAGMLSLATDSARSRQKTYPDSISAHSAKPDSAKMYNLPLQVIEAERKNENKENAPSYMQSTIYNSDVFKSLTINPGITTTIPNVSSELLWHSRPIDIFYGNGASQLVTTQTTFSGGYPLINAEFTSLSLEESSAGTNTISAAMRLEPKASRQDMLKLSTDFVQREVAANKSLDIPKLGIKTIHGIGIKNFNVLFLKKFIDQFKFFPQSTDLEYLLTIENIEGADEEYKDRVMLDAKTSKETSSYTSTDGELTKYEEDRQPLRLYAAYLLSKGNTKLNLEAMHEQEHIDSRQDFIIIDTLRFRNMQSIVKNTTLDANLKYRAEKASYEAGADIAFLTSEVEVNDDFRYYHYNDNRRIIATKAYAKAKYLIGERLLLSSDIGITASGKKYEMIGGGRITLIDKTGEASIGYEHVGNFLIYSTGLIDRLLITPKELKPRTADHYLIEYKTTTNEAVKGEALIYWTNFHADIVDRQTEGELRGIDLSARYDAKIYCAASLAISDSKIRYFLNDPIQGSPGVIPAEKDWMPLPGSSRFIGQVQAGYVIEGKHGLNDEFSASLRYQSGRYQGYDEYLLTNRYRDPWAKTGGSAYLSLGWKHDFRMFDKPASLSVSVQNVLYLFGQRNPALEITESNGNSRAIDMPIWGNVAISWEL
jgi:hypothetical protein